MKRCSHCSEEKELNKFSKHKKQKDGLQNWCKECNKTAGMIYYYKNRAYRLEYHRKSTYKISKEKYDNLVENQNNKCFICNQEETSKDKNGNIKSLSVDHCHITNKIRSLLCSKCNTILGMASDNSDLLIAAANYLMKHNEKEI